MVAIMGIVIGIAVAFIVYAIHRFFPTTAAIDALLLLLLHISCTLLRSTFIIPVFYRLLAAFIPQLSFAGIFSYESRLMSRAYGILYFFIKWLCVYSYRSAITHHQSRLGNYSIGEAIFYGYLSVFLQSLSVLYGFPWCIPAAFFI